MGKSNPYLSRKIDFFRYRCSDIILEDILIKKDTNSKKRKARMLWPVRAFLLALAISAILSFLSSEMLDGTGILIAVLLLLVIIAIGVVFDMIGTAVTAATIQPFHAMSAHKEKGGKEAVKLIQNANMVNSICNDIVGDICAVVAGTTGTILVEYLKNQFDTKSVLISIAVTALISSLTIGGKALGKIYAMDNCTKIVTIVAKFLNIFRKK